MRMAHLTSVLFHAQSECSSSHNSCSSFSSALRDSKNNMSNLNSGLSLHCLQIHTCLFTTPHLFTVHAFTCYIRKSSGGTGVGQNNYIPSKNPLPFVITDRLTLNADILFKLAPNQFPPLSLLSQVTALPSSPHCAAYQMRNEWKLNL